VVTVPDLAVDHRRTQGLLAPIIGRAQTRAMQEGVQLIAVFGRTFRSIEASNTNQTGGKKLL